VGVTGGIVGYSFPDVMREDERAIEGSVRISGYKAHIGAVFEFRYFEAGFEQGFVSYDHGIVPSPGLRWAFKGDWKR
jgi:hypothetical protein